jgi:hypothetical protein
LRRTPARGVKTVINKVPGGNDNFYDETGKGWDHAFKLGPQKSALANLPEDETKFPVATWAKRILSEGIDTIALKSASMRKPSPPGQPKGFKPDVSNVPWVIETLAFFRLRLSDPPRLSFTGGSVARRTTAHSLFRENTGWRHRQRLW